ncbi:MAG: DNA polymerase III subunit [Chlamydiia bacterium]|nr:DNA polymerase III subunit [Chlamydiia bacterium]
MFDGILGNEPIKSYLRGALAKGRLAHALLFSGLDGIGKSLFAERVAARLLGASLERVLKNAHPDFHPMHPEGKTGLHTIERLRSLIDTVHMEPFESPSRVFVIYEAERMQPAAANALLKTLEEPSSTTFFFLLARAAQDLLPTLVSRCAVLHFQPLKEEEVASLLKQRGLSERFAKLGNGSIGQALEYAAHPLLEGNLFSFLAEPKSYPEIVRFCEKTEKEVEDEDPIKRSRNIDRLLAAILMWHRDQALRCVTSIENRRLFFPEAPPAQKPLPPLSAVETILEETRTALSRNMRFAVCLERVFG